MIDINNLSVQFTGSYLFEDVNLKILPSDRIALVGSNGTGKSTFLKILAGSQAQEDGSIQFKKGIKIGYLPQETILKNENTIFEDVRNSVSEIKKLEDSEKEITHLLSNTDLSNEEHNKLIEQQGNLTDEKEKLGYYELNSKIEKILMGLGFSDNEFEKKTSELSGGWQMRVELAKILISDNDIILLDEPTNHLDIDSLQWLVKFLKSYTGAIILVSHDRYFVNNICNKTLEIFRNNITFYKGNYNDYLNFKIERDKQLKLEYADQQKKIKQTEKFIERFRYKSTKAKQVQSRVKQLEKIDKVELSDNENKINFRFFETQKSGVIPIKIENLSKSYEDNLVLNNVNLQIERGEKIALVGPNGAGKTTLSKLISHRLKPSKGSIELGHNTIISFYAQDVVDNLNLENDIISEIADSDSENTTVQLRTILGAFLFNGDDVFKKIKILSGGEKSRVALAKVLLTKANTIILDEPTNHLDFDSKKIVQEALMKFSGTLIIVSHDVDFLRPIVNKVIEVRNKNIQQYYGGIDYYLTKREEYLDTEQNNNSSSSNNKISRKEEKRLAAEKRQKEFNATKHLKEKISEIELEIENLEEEKQFLENEIIQEKVYSNPVLAKENRNKFASVNKKLEECYTDWTLTTEELEKIQEQFL